ncbi:hypothetical protein TGAMA5MH_02709 [Trichoderma gamsii]|uniref:Uncharacterized protein n=1 Tax=Trichoderma gamsii TaxID=398673 RepID=A0A2K0TIY0_9HYPO|nr:hypothetical protein TGAMA5MH_02709 [Trichoderma gamsii]
MPTPRDKFLGCYDINTQRPGIEDEEAGPEQLADEHRATPPDYDKIFSYPRSLYRMHGRKAEESQHRRLAA